MGQAGLLRFARSFSLFPDLVGKARLEKFFHLLTALTQSKPRGLDLSLFVELLILCASTLPTPPLERKLAFLLERMLNAKGVQEVMKARGVTSLPKKARLATLLQSLRPLLGEA